MFQHVWVRRGIVTVLALVLVGPLLAPLFAASGVPLLGSIAEDLIYPLGAAVCPEDFMLPHWHGHFLAVCARCYAALLSMVSAWVVVSRSAGWLGWLHFARLHTLVAVAVVVVAWQFDVWGMNRGLWTHSNAYEIVAGMVLGITIGLSSGAAAHLP